jgi:O-antigen/teichoic acid export membrane protein
VNAATFGLMHALFAAVFSAVLYVAGIFLAQTLYCLRKHHSECYWIRRAFAMTNPHLRALNLERIRLSDQSVCSIEERPCKSVRGRVV